METVELSGYGARLSMPGYMDCIEWSVFDTAQEAAQYLLDTYYDLDTPVCANGEDEVVEALERVVQQGL